MANSLLTMSMITRKALALFRNSNAFLQTIDRQYDDQFARKGYKIGNTLQIRLPNDYVVRTGVVAAPQDTVESSVTLTLATQKGVDMKFGSAELALSMDDFADRVLAPAVNALAGQVAADVMSGSDAIPNLVHAVDGSNNTVKPTVDTWLAAGALMDNYSVPQDGRLAIVGPSTMARSVATMIGLYNPQTTISKQFASGLISQNVLGFNWAKDQSVMLHTTGSFSSGGTVNGANQTGNTLAVNAITGTLKKGDIITIANVNQVNRVLKSSTGSLQQFVVMADVNTGGTSISIYPAITPPSGGNAVIKQTVDSSPANGAAIALVTVASEKYRKNFVFHPTACTMVTADLDLPTGAVVAAGREAYDGIALRIIRDFDFTNDAWPARLDILYGYCWPRPEWACIVADLA